MKMASTFMSTTLCPQHSNCEAPISVIIDILAMNDPLRSEKISNDFKLLGFAKIKDLANTTLTVATRINSLGDDSMAELCIALQIYDQQLVEQLKSAKLEYDQNNYVKTQEICNGLLVHKPTDVKVLVLLSASYFCCGEYASSLKYLLRAQEIDPNSSDVLLNLGVHFYHHGKLKEAFAYYTEAFLKMNVKKINDLIEFAKLMTQTGSKYEAEIMYKIILHMSPDLYIERNAYAKVLISMNKLEEAENQYNIAKQTAPQNFDTWNNLGSLYVKMGKTKEAIRCYMKASKLNCTSPMVWTNLGIVYFKLKNHQNAIDNFQKALELYPEDSIDILKYLGNVYWDQKNWPLFVDTFKNVWKLKPNEEDTNFKLGYVYYYHFNNYQEAEKYFENLVKINSENVMFHNYVINVYLKQSKKKCACEAAILLADLYSRQNDYVNAKNSYVLALHLNPENPYGHEKLGNLQYSHGYLESALERYKYAISLKLDFSKAYYGCGNVYKKMNLLEKALENYTLAHALDPDNFNYLKNLILLHKKLGHEKDVEKLYPKFFKQSCERYCY